MSDRDRDPGRDEDVLTKERVRTQPPRMYKVLLHNDDYTPMEFVVMVLEVVFRNMQETGELTAIRQRVVAELMRRAEQGLPICEDYACFEPLADGEARQQ